MDEIRGKEISVTKVLGLSKEGTKVAKKGQRTDTV
jgi:hypothetical protein